jgi:hypothetical protein
MKHKKIMLGGIIFVILMIVLFVSALKTRNNAIKNNDDDTNITNNDNYLRNRNNDDYEAGSSANINIPQSSDNSSITTQTDTNETTTTESNQVVTQIHTDEATYCWIEASSEKGPAPLSVKLTYYVNYTDSNINPTGIQWDFDGDNTWDTKFSYMNGELTHTFNNGKWNVRMRVQFSDQSITLPCNIEINAY